MTDSLFDAERDPFADMRNALETAQREHKNILVELGGDWCIWCHRLDAFIKGHPQLRYLREIHYVSVKVLVGDDEQKNKTFLEHLPGFDGVPHIFIYNSRGQLLCSQDTSVLEEGESYHFGRVREFLSRWSEPRLTPYDALDTAELKRLVEHYYFGETANRITPSA
ncbi:thioredoxin family protein [Herpetosiphon geysericola]|uniref:thioredoxin family protein n=1 Tax=Herpetosiphon geysericola TaxID=70996 RepID=UPI0006C92942|nr:thioredoxin family protein [Herpetosiphon geysericola]